jgi:serine/threonine-protein kinase
VTRTPREGGLEEGRRGLGLGLRFFIGVALLLAATLATAVAVASRHAGEVAEAKIAADLKVVPAIFAGYVDNQASVRKGQVRSLAEEPGTKALLAEALGHEATLHDTATSFAAGLSAGAVFLLDEEGRLLTRSDRAPGEEAGRDFSSVSWVSTPLGEERDASSFILDVTRTKTLYLVASAPVHQGAGRERRLLGVLAATFPMDGERVRELAGMTSGEVAFVANLAARGAPAPSLDVLVATDALRNPAFVAALAAAREALAPALFQRGETVGPLELGGSRRPYIATAIPVRSGAREPVAALLVARSEEAEMAVFRRIRKSLLVVAGAALLVALPLSFLLTQGLARPIRELARAAEQIGRGHLEAPLPRNRTGEVGALAGAFAFMVSELEAKAQLEAILADLQRRPGDVTLRGMAPTSSAGADAADALGPGSLFASRYEVLSVLGQGGMGAVFRVRDRELDAEIALKLLKAPLPGVDPGWDGLRQEIRLARMITHANVVRVHDYGESGGARFLTMEYVPGTTLRELLDRKRGLELTPALQIAKQVCRGLVAVHRAGIVHGDLKPQNVMVMGNGVVKLMDFGVARAGVAFDHGSPVVGTPLYMSPEQVRGAEIDERSDLYSAGVVLFELFTGRTPFRSPDAVEVMGMHLNEPPPSPRSVRPDLPETLSRLILSCLDKAKLRRPASAAELERMLMRVRP